MGFLLLLDENLKNPVKLRYLKIHFLKEEKKIPTDFRNELEKKTNKNLVVAGPFVLCVCVCVCQEDRKKFKEVQTRVNLSEECLRLCVICIIYRRVCR